MESSTDHRWEQSLAEVAGRFDYPPTPPLAAVHRGRRAAQPAARRPAATGRRLAWGLAVLLLITLALLAAPQTRAALLSFFSRVGAIQIFIDGAAPTLAPPPTVEPSTSPAAPADATDLDAVGHSLSLIALGEPTTLADAARSTGFAPRLPTALGPPDEVYLHRDVDLPAVTLVWREAGGAPLSLTQIAIAEFARKLVSEGGVRETTVNGVTAMWLPGPHTLLLFGDWQPNPIPIASNVLIWAGDGFTYRLEGDLTLEEARRIAESIAPLATPVGD